MFGLISLFTFTRVVVNIGRAHHLVGYLLTPARTATAELFGKRGELMGKRAELFGKRAELFGKKRAAMTNDGGDDEISMLLVGMPAIG